MTEENRINQVYTIRICLNPSKERQNTITIYEIRERNLIGEVHEAHENMEAFKIRKDCCR